MDNQPLVVDGVNKYYFWKVLFEQGTVGFLTNPDDEVVTDSVVSPKYAILNSRI